MRIVAVSIVNFRYFRLCSTLKLHTITRQRQGWFVGSSVILVYLWYLSGKLYHNYRSREKMSVEYDLSSWSLVSIPRSYFHENLCCQATTQKDYNDRCVMTCVSVTKYFDCPVHDTT